VSLIEYESSSHWARHALAPLAAEMYNRQPSSRGQQLMHSSCTAPCIPSPQAYSPLPPFVEIGGGLGEAGGRPISMAATLSRPCGGTPRRGRWMREGLVRGRVRGRAGEGLDSEAGGGWRALRPKQFA
jgi:hypothetical protein